MEKPKPDHQRQTFQRSLFSRGKHAAKRETQQPKKTEDDNLLRSDISLSGFIDDEDDHKHIQIDGCDDELNGKDSNDKLAEEEEFEFDDATAESTTASYIDRLKKDFDSRKTYEDLVLRILNYYQRSPQKPPADSSSFKTRFAKSKQDLRKRTLYLDLDDLLISVSMFQHPSRSGLTVDIKDASGKNIQVRIDS